MKPGGFRHLGRHWYNWWPTGSQAQNHYLNQLRLIVNWTFRTNFNEICVQHNCLLLLLLVSVLFFRKMQLKLSTKCWPLCSGLNVSIITRRYSILECLITLSPFSNKLLQKITWKGPIHTIEEWKKLCISDPECYSAKPVWNWPILTVHCSHQLGNFVIGFFCDVFCPW